MQAVEGAVIACAGLGSRLGMGMPKCMIELEEKTVLSRLIESLRPLVPRIHVVVGYREELIVAHCAQYHRDVVIVRNPDFRTTNTAHSIHLGSIGMNSKVLYLDGDLIIDPASLRSFVSRGTERPLLIGVTRSKSSQAVFVTVPDGNVMNPTMIDAFQRDTATPWEWANVFIGSPQLLKAGTRYVYECIEPFLPCAVQMIDLHEVDTPEDLEQAKAWLLSHSSSTTA